MPEFWNSLTYRIPARVPEVRNSEIPEFPESGRFWKSVYPGTAESRSSLIPIRNYGIPEFHCGKAEFRTFQSPSQVPMFKTYLSVSNYGF